jgi:hypothetical protein
VIGRATAGLLLSAGLLLVGASPAGAGERLLYAVVHKGPAFDASHTEIYSVDPASGERRLLFSDEDLPIVLLQHLYVFHFPVAGGGRIFAHAADRGAPGPLLGIGGIYEIATDGIRGYRRVAGVEGDQSLGDLIADPAGARVGYVERTGRREYLFLLDAGSGRMLRKLDVTGMILDCEVSSAGWDPQSGRLYLSAAAGDDDVTSEASRSRAGTYVIDETGDRWTKIASIPPLPGFHPPEDARMIGVLPGGAYVFETTQLAIHPGMGPARFSSAVVSLDPATGRVQEIGFRAAGGRPPGARLLPTVSPSGAYLAGATPPGSSTAVSQEIRIKDLHTGLERELVTLPCDGGKGPFLGLVGWLTR